MKMGLFSLPFNFRVPFILGLALGTFAATEGIEAYGSPMPARAARVSEEPQLAVAPFAGCLASEAPTLSWRALAVRHALSKQDGFLTFLSVYPNRRIPLLDRLKQEPAHRRWQVAFEAAEERLVTQLYLLSEAPLLPGPVFHEALAACRASRLAVVSDDVLCATLILHNALRTMGRHAQAVLDETQDLNPHWYRANPAFWNEVFPLIQSSLISLRPDGRGDRFGEWYHFFGILAFAVHEAALRGADDAPEPEDLWLAELATQANRVLNPLLAGGQEAPEKARLDLDSLEVAKAWFFARPVVSTPCDLPGAYVAKRPGSSARPSLH